MTPTRILFALTLIMLTSCASVRFYAAWYADSALHRNNQKVLTVRISEHCGQVTGLVRESEAADLVAVCDADCNCKLVKGRVRPKANAGICQ